MRRLLGSVVPALVLTGLLTGLLAGCGDDGSGTVTDDPAPTPSGSAGTSGEPTDDVPGDGSTDVPTPVETDRDGGEPVDFELVETMTETAAGGEATLTAVPLGDDSAVQAFTSGFQEKLQTRIQNAVEGADVPDGMLLYGAVIWVGCESPTEVEVVQGASGLEVHAVNVRMMKECFAPMTTVALVLVPESAA